jgi:cell division protein FtsZ
VFFEIVSPEPVVAPAPEPVAAPVAAAPAMTEIKDVREIEVFEPEFVVAAKKEEEQFTFSFDLSTDNIKREEKVLFSLSDETRDIKVNEPVQVVPVTELNETGIVRYSLEEYLEKETELLESKPVAKVEEPIAPELNLTMKTAEQEPAKQTSANEDISPVEMTIEETLKMRAEERRRKMKEFNYKFHNSSARIDEIEKEPAYKRMGIDLNDSRTDNSKSRLSLGTDSNDDLQLRSNNSFLHDNVD